MDQLSPSHDDHLPLGGQFTVYKGGWIAKIVSVFFAPIIFIFFCWMPAALAFESVERVGYPLASLVAIGAVCGALFYTYCLVYIFKSRIEVLWPVRMRIIYPFKRVDVEFNEIKGFVVSQYKGADTSFEMFYKHYAGRSIKLRIMMNNHKEFTMLVKRYFHDIEQTLKNEAKEQLIHDPKLSVSKDERERYLQKAKSSATFANILGVSSIVPTCIFVIYYGNPLYKHIVLWGLVFCPWVVIGIVAFFKGIVTLEGDDPASVYPSAKLGFILPCAALWIYSCGVKIVAYNNLFMPFIGIFIALFCSVMFVCKWQHTKFVSIFYLAIACLGYGYGSTIFIDTALDRQPFTAYAAEILERHPKQGKSSDRFVLAPWGPLKECIEVGVSKELYNKFTGNEITVIAHKGTLDIPWYEIGNNEIKE